MKKDQQTQGSTVKTEEQIKKSIDYNAVIAHNQKYIDILVEEKQWHELEINRIDQKVLKGAGNDLKHEMSLKRILSHKKIYQIDSEIESKLNFIEQLKGFLKNERKDK